MIHVRPHSTHSTPALVLLVASGLVVASGLACKPKECDAVLDTSGKVQAALLAFELTAAKGGLDAVVAASASSEAHEIAWLSHQATTLATAIDEMQRPNPAADERDGISTDFERHNSAFLDARGNVRRICE